MRDIITYGSSWYGTDMIHYAENQTEKVVYLTIDDFPSIDLPSTEQLLNLLQGLEVPVCFFVIQYNLKQEKLNEILVHRLLNEGHELGNHYDIDKSATDLSEEKFKQYLLGTEKWLDKYDIHFSSRLPKFFRPPYGKTNDKMTKVLKENNYINILGDVYTLDGTYDYRAEEHAQLIINGVQEGSIIILHSPEEFTRRKTFEILKIIVPELKKKGYKFELLSSYFRKNKNEKERKEWIKAKKVWDIEMKEQ